MDQFIAQTTMEQYLPLSGAKEVPTSNLFLLQRCAVFEIRFIPRCH